jgi:hypothetical protein
MPGNARLNIAFPATVQKHRGPGAIRRTGPLIISLLY